MIGMSSASAAIPKKHETRNLCLFFIIATFKFKNNTVSIA